MLSIIKKGSRGVLVKAWQEFLRSQGYKIKADGIFGLKTKRFTLLYQNKKNLYADGIVGKRTYRSAILNGFADYVPAQGANSGDGLSFKPDPKPKVPKPDLKPNPKEEPISVVDKSPVSNSPSWPAKPRFIRRFTKTERANIFGTYKYARDPVHGNKEKIKIIDNWETKNIVSVYLPQLKYVSGSRSTNTIRVHKKISDNLKKMWNAWERAGLISLVKTFNGDFAPRFIRGSTTNLSDHAFGLAFDINYQWNKFGSRPALASQIGSVRQLVPIANSYGFYWGGHYTRPDGMHFEYAKFI